MNMASAATPIKFNMPLFPAIIFLDVFLPPES
jgi:hypothetical protein